MKLSKRKDREIMEKEKKPFFIKRGWRKFRGIDWSNPVNKWKGIFFGSVSLVAIAAFSFAALTLTSTTTFCKTCHEMAPEYASHQTSSHAEVACATCHIPPDGPVKYVMAKAGALAEVYYHIVGYPNPLRQTEGKAIPNRTCQQCHTENREITTNGLIVNHNEHVKDQGLLCINCHAGVAHGKVVERGLIYTEDLEHWDADDFEAARLLITPKDRGANMGTCMECHMKVNDGGKPWKDVSYAIPNMESKTFTSKATFFTEFENPDTGKAMTQSDVLRRLDQTKDSDRISMDCKTCHVDLTTPKNHQDKKWAVAHGDSATADVESCVSCHDDRLWVRRLPHNDDGYKDELAQRTRLAKKGAAESPVEKIAEVRENAFCSSCHSVRPATHGSGSDWMTGHMENAKTADEKQACFTCHDLDPKSRVSKDMGSAPAEIDCIRCHVTGEFDSPTP